MDTIELQKLRMEYGLCEWNAYVSLHYIFFERIIGDGMGWKNRIGGGEEVQLMRLSKPLYNQ